MLSRLLHRASTASSRRCRPRPSSMTSPAQPSTRIPLQLKLQLQQRWMTPAPRPGDGPLMSRRSDRQLPDLAQVKFRWGRTLPVFVALVSLCAVAIFNYQKTSSPIVSSTLYALRTNDRARALLGDDIYFRRPVPWIAGQMNQMRGRIDIRFAVRGTRGWATMRFASHRPSSRSLFETTEWSLTTEDGRWIDLLEDGDPFRGLLADCDDNGLGSLGEHDDEDGAANSTRGFRQQGVLNK